MAESLLSAVNRTLKAVKVIQGEDGALSSLTDAAKQGFIDIAVDKINMVTREIYRLRGEPLPIGTGTGNITLVSGTREYTLPTALIRIRWPLIQQTAGYKIHEYPGGYEAMWRDQAIPTQYTGRPNFAAVNPSTGDLRMDNTPTANEDSEVYVVFYDKSLTLALAADTFPFHDDAVIAMIPAVAELWRADQRNQFREKIFNISLSQTAGIVAKLPRKEYW